MSFQKQIKKILKDERRSRKLSQVEVGESLNLASHLIGRAENPKHDSSCKTLERLAKFYGLKINVSKEG